MKNEMVCTRCGTVGRTRTETPGHFLVEVVMWVSFLVPGVLYSVWRSVNRYKVCAACGEEKLVPVDSPVGQRLVA